MLICARRRFNLILRECRDVSRKISASALPARMLDAMEGTMGAAAI
jgi:hypothetical protein